MQPEETRAFSGTETTVRCLLSGSRGAGKTSFFSCVTGGKFETSLMLTAGVDYRNVRCKRRGEWIRVQVWDQGTAERFRPLTRAYYHGANVVLCCIDLTDSDWSNLYRDTCTFLAKARSYTPEDSVIVLVGCKKDLVSERAVTAEQACELAAEMLGDFEYMECSSKTGEGVREVVSHAVKKYLDRPKPQESPVQDSTDNPPERRKWCIVM